MNRLITYKLLLGIVILFCTTAFGQAPGSGNTENSSRYIGGTRTTLGESLYIGPGANITIDGTWHVYSKYVWISPLAQISGNGTIIFHNSAEVSGSGGPTIIDGNDNLFIDVNIVHDNSTGMAINNVVLPASLASDGWADNTGVSTLKIGKDFNMNVDGADVWLDATAGVTGDFVFDSNATISNYRPERMVITNNSIQSHMVKQGAMGGFVFPVGISDGNYTPAQITGSGNYHVSVQDYAASASNETLLQGGPQRTWHVYADVAGSATVAFQHYTSDDQSPFSSASPHFVTQYEGASWSTATEEAGLPATFTTGTSPVTGSSTQDLTGVPIPDSATSNGSYLTKTNIKSLPVTIVAFKVSKENNSANISWSTSEETNSDVFQIERSADAKNWIYIGEKAAAGDSKGLRNYSFSDLSPLSGINYYRLKMIDRDQTFAYSSINQINFSENLLYIFPNPTSGLLRFDRSLHANVKKVQLLNTTGKVIFKTEQIPENGINVRGLVTNGTYVVIIDQKDGSRSVHKIVVKQ